LLIHSDILPKIPPLVEPGNDEAVVEAAVGLLAQMLYKGTFTLFTSYFISYSRRKPVDIPGVIALPTC
jgi:hypothetical protein